MRISSLPVLLSTLALVLGGCASFGQHKSSAVRTRAAFDLSCPQDKLQVTPLSNEAMDRATYGVTGCGKKASYVYVPGAGAVLNSAVDAK